MLRHTPIQEEITTFGDFVDEVNNSINGTNKGVYATCSDGGVHLVTGGVVQMDDTIYANTTYGVQEIVSAKVLK